MDYLPMAEKTFNEWQVNFTKQVTDNLALWSIPPTATDVLVKAKGVYESAYAIANKGMAKVRTPEQTKVKLDATQVYKAAIRQFVKQWLAFNDAVTNAKRLAMGINVRDTIRTASGTPSTIPNIVVVPLPGSNIKVTFKQAPDNEGISRRSKPADVREIEIAAWIGPDAPTDGESCAMKYRYTRNPVIVKFRGEDGGKSASIFARWIGKNKEAGDWGNAMIEVISK